MVATPLDGKVALVTGAARGIGRGIALELARLGADVIVAGRSTVQSERAPGTIHATAADVEALGRKAAAIKVDIGLPGGAESLVDESIAAFGHVDILVNNAAVTAHAIFLPLWDLTREQFERTVTVNVTAPFVLTQLLTKQMVDGGGTVINLTSRSANLVPADPPPSGPLDPTVLYGSTKAMVSRMTNALARELKPHNIGCYALDPGFTRTEIIVRMMESTPRAGAGNPVEWAARVAGWLATSPDAMAHTGQVVSTTQVFLEEHDLPL